MLSPEPNQYNQRCLHSGESFMLHWSWATDVTWTVLGSEFSDFIKNILKCPYCGHILVLGVPNNRLACMQSQKTLSFSYIPSSLPSCLTFSQTNWHSSLCPHLSVDRPLPDRQAAASEAGQTPIQNSHHQHWCPSGLRSLPTALLPLHKWLHFKGPLCQAPEVCGQHYSHRHHQGWRRVCLQTGGGAAGCLVQS